MQNDLRSNIAPEVQEFTQTTLGTIAILQASSTNWITFEPEVIQQELSESTTSFFASQSMINGKDGIFIYNLFLHIDSSYVFLENIQNVMNNHF